MQPTSEVEMRKPSSAKHVGKLKSSAVVFLVLFAPVLLAAYAGSPPATSTGPVAVQDTVRIEVTLQEFTISPTPLRIPAGKPVVLVITNHGLIPHEFMAGREARDGAFAHDLFAAVEVTMSDEDPSGHAYAEEAEHDEADEHDAAGEHVHDAGAHGTMATADPGKTVYMTFTLPESRRGEWSTGCFLVGHYEAGMHGVLIVE